MSYLLLGLCYVFLVIPAALMMMLFLLLPLAVIGTGVLMLLISYSSFVKEVEREFQSPAIDHEMIDQSLRQAS